MARPLRIEYEGAVYHVASRGNEKKDIFETSRDREKLLEYIGHANEKLGLSVHAYSLMDNHYHMVVETPQANLSRCMQLVNSSYTAYFNAKKDRVGHLFQGRYKAILVEKDRYMKELSRYIHLNPVRAKLSKKPEDYPWSSYRYYIDKGEKIPPFMNVGFTLSLFEGNAERYRSFVEEGLLSKQKNLFAGLKAGCILGGEDFVENIKKTYLPQYVPSRDVPELRKLAKKIFPKETILKAVEKESDKAYLYVYFLRKYTSHSMLEIADLAFDSKMSVSGLSKIVSRIEEKQKKDRGFAVRLEEIEEKLSHLRSDPSELTCI